MSDDRVMVIGRTENRITRAYVCGDGGVLLSEKTREAKGAKWEESRLYLTAKEWAALVRIWVEEFGGFTHKTPPDAEEKE